MRHGISAALSDHPLALEVTNKASDVLKGLYPDYQKFVSHTGKLRMSTPPPPLSQADHYYTDTFYAVASIIGTTERMENAQLFLRRFPSPQAHRRQGINQHDWLEYHFGYFIVSMVGLYDAALVLTNVVMRLGNQYRNCRPDIIATNGRVRGTPAGAALKKLELAIRPYKQARNTHVHRGYRMDPSEILGSNDLDMFQLLSFTSSRGSTLVTQADLDLLFIASAEEMRSALRTRLDELQIALSSLLDCLLPHYRSEAWLLEHVGRQVVEL